MKTMQTIILVLKNIRKRAFINLCLILLEIFIFFMMQLTAVNGIAPFAAKWMTEHAMGTPLSKWGIITMDSEQDWEQGEVRRFREALKEAGIVDRLGAFTFMGMQDSGLSELARLQNRTSAKRNTALDDETVYCCEADDLSLFLPDIRIDPEVIGKYRRADDVLLLLGNSYRQIETGTVYQSEYGERSYVAAGIFPAGYSFFSETVYLDDEVFNAGLSDCLDDMVVLVYQDQSQLTAKTLFFAEEGVSDQKLEEIRALADDCGCRITESRLETVYERNHRSALKETQYVLPYFGLILTAGIMMVLSYHLADLLGRQRKYGIYHALGFSIRDISGMLCGENMIRGGIAFFAAVFLFFRMFRRLYPRGSIDPHTELLLFTFASLSTLLLLCVMIFLDTRIPLAFLKQKTPGEMIDDFEE